MRSAPALLALAAAALLHAAAPAAGERYWKGSELDVRPTPFAAIDPEPPGNSADKAGRVIARVFIDESGAAERVIVEKSDPSGLFDESVVAAFKKARYRPGYKNGIRVKSQMLVEVTFHGLKQVSAPPAPGAK